MLEAFVDGEEEDDAEGGEDRLEAPGFGETGGAPFSAPRVGEVEAASAEAAALLAAV